MTYADGVADIDLHALSTDHARHRPRATMTVVRPELQFGIAEINGDGVVRGFVEKPRSDHWVNGGFFCFEPSVFELLTTDSVLERDPLAALAERGSCVRFATRASGTAWTRTRTPSSSTICGPPAGPRGSCGMSGHSVVLVTGAYGLLGSWLVRALLAAEARVVVVRRDDATGTALARMGLEEQVDIVHGDICTDGLVARALARIRGRHRVPPRGADDRPDRKPGPPRRLRRISADTWMVLEACRHHGAERVVVASSDKAYGPHRELPYREDHALQPVFPYDVSKAATDLLARSYWHTWQLPVAVTRFANLYGGGDTNRSRLVPEAVTAALAGRSPVVRSDGSPERDFLYVEDAVAAYLAIAGALGRGEGRGEAFNAGGGRPHRVLDVVELICRLAGTGVTPDVRGAGTPPGEIDQQWVDYGKLQALTGWEPRTPLEEGLQRTLDWYRERG